jgi:hypothetical protein
MELVEITAKAQIDQNFAGRENRFCLVQLHAKSYEEMQGVSVDHNVVCST